MHGTWPSFVHLDPCWPLQEIFLMCSQIIMWPVNVWSRQLIIDLYVKLTKPEIHQSRDSGLLLFCLVKVTQSLWSPRQGRYTLKWLVCHAVVLQLKPHPSVRTECWTVVEPTSGVYGCAGSQIKLTAMQIRRGEGLGGFWSCEGMSIRQRVGTPNYPWCVNN